MQVADSQSPPVTATAPLSITVNATLAPLTVVTTSLPVGTQNTGYSAMLAANGGVTPYTWSITAGNLPRGLSLNTITGAILGTPSGGGTSNFTVQVTDSNTPAANASAPLSITIHRGGAVEHHHDLATGRPDGHRLQRPADRHRWSQPLHLEPGQRQPAAWFAVEPNHRRDLRHADHGGDIELHRAGGRLGNAACDRHHAPLSITISPSGGGNPGLLSGHYAFYLNGFNSSGAWTLAGSFISDGNGNITSGFVDGNSVTGQPFNTTVSGTYFIAADGLNTLTIQGTSFGPATYAFGLDSTGNGRIIEYDDTTGQGSRGSGALRKQDPTAFSLSKLNGGYAFGMAGVDNSAGRFTDVGVFTLSNGNITNGACDINDGGTFQTCTFTGSLPAIGTQTGRAVSTIQSN